MTGFDTVGALVCQSFIPNPGAVTVDFPMVCSNNLTVDLSEVLFQFTIDPSVIQGNQSFTADIAVAMIMPQEFMQVAVNVIGLGTDSFEITAAQSTVTVPGGAAGADVILTASTPLVVPIPLDSTGLVVVSDANVPLTPATGNYVADASGTVLFDFSRAGNDPDPLSFGPSYTDPLGPIGLRASFSGGGFLVALECEGGTVVSETFQPNPLTDPPLISFSIH